MRAEGARAERRCALALFAFLACLFCVCAQPGVFNPDAEVEFQTARSLLLRGHAGLSDAHPDASSAEIGIVRFERSPGKRGFDVMQGLDGLYYSWFGVGHALVMLPFVAAGRGLGGLFPELEARAVSTAVEQARALGANEGFARAFAEDFFAHALVGFHSALFAAGIGLLLYLLLGHLGFGGRARLVATLLACVTTQLWPGARECMSDVTAGFFLLLAVERVVAWQRGRAGRGALALAGAAGGFSMLCRAVQVVPFAAIGIYVFVVCLQRGAQPRGARGWLAALGAAARASMPCALAALPFVVAMLAFNDHRFGDVREFGYSAGTSEGYWNFPLHLGLLFLLFAPGKGALVFSPLLWLAPLGLRKARARGASRGELSLAVAIFVTPLLVVAMMTGWHASQSWAVRYSSLGAAVLIAISVAAILQGVRPRSFARRAVVLLAALGFVINLGGIVTSYRGYYDLGQHAWQARWGGQVDPREDLFQRAVLTPRLSPALGHWLYALESARGRLPAGADTDSETRAAVWKSVYGVVPTDRDGQVRSQALQFVEDRDFGHLWWVAWARRFGTAAPLWLALALALAAAAAARAAFRASDRAPS